MSGSDPADSGAPAPGPASTPAHPLHLHEAFGVEIECMIVDAATLEVRPVCDELFRRILGREGSDAGAGDLGAPADDPIGWSNELVLHVLEFKTVRPVPALAGLAPRFDASIARANAVLADLGCRLLPGGMHPWMDPHAEVRLWPHEAGEIYRAYDRIFDCRGHGWGNLQSTHLNLSFADDEEFDRLHTAIRTVLPLLPALAAASPVVDGRRARHLDERMEVYRTNSRRIPSMTGLVVPEPVHDRAAYEREILGRLYADLAPHDPEGLLRHEFANARGAIARFDRGSIEIRVLDAQECPRADLALCGLVASVVRALADDALGDAGVRHDLDTLLLHEVLRATITDAGDARIETGPLRRALGLPGDAGSAADAWRHLIDAAPPDDPVLARDAATLVDAGSLAGRLARRIGETPSREVLRATWRELADCFAEGRWFDAG